jgi:hypothetical protein
MFIKKKLPHRSLDLIIKKLYRRVEEKEPKYKEGNVLGNSAIAIGSVAQVEPNITQNSLKDDT